jgi:hypothetical protein
MRAARPEASALTADNVRPERVGSKLESNTKKETRRQRKSRTTRKPADDHLLERQLFRVDLAGKKMSSEGGCEQTNISKKEQLEKTNSLFKGSYKSWSKVLKGA